VMVSLLSLNVAGQERTITGKVISTEDNQSVPGVNVIVPSTTIGTVSGSDGSYSIKVPESSKQLTFTALGLKSKTVDIGKSNSIDVYMEPDVLKINEVVVTALGVRREEKSLGYATQVVNGNEISAAKETNFINSLQ